jgi:hypothetical protein
LLPGTSQAIGKRLSGCLNDTSVAPEFTPKRNSELSDNRDWRPHDAVRLEIGSFENEGAVGPEPCLGVTAGEGCERGLVMVMVRGRSTRVCLVF